MKIKNLIIFSVLILTACDLEMIDSGLGSGAYVINAEVTIRSNTDFPIASAEVKMDWKIDDYNISNRDSNYTNSEGLVDLQTYIPTYYLPNDLPQISFYVSSSAFEDNITTINGNSFTEDMLDTLTNQYVQNINYTIYLIPE